MHGFIRKKLKIRSPQGLPALQVVLGTTTSGTTKRPSGQPISQRDLSSKLDGYNVPTFPAKAVTLGGYC